MLPKIFLPRVHFGIDTLLSVDDDDPFNKLAEELRLVPTKFTDKPKAVGAGRDRTLSGRGSQGGQFIAYTSEEEEQLGLRTIKTDHDDPQFSGFNRLA